MVLKRGFFKSEFSENALQINQIRWLAYVFLSPFFSCKIRFKDSTGWTFGSNGEDTLKAINTRHVLPVELNAYLCQNAAHLSHLYERVGRRDKAEFYREIKDRFRQMIQAVFWDETVGSWFDYDLDGKLSRLHFYPTNIAPLWTNCVHDG